MQRVDLNEIARNVIELSRGRAESARVEVTLTLFEGGVPVMSDRDRIIQVMTNLFATRSKRWLTGGALHVATFSGVYRAGRAGVEFSVRDEGPGLPPAGSGASLRTENLQQRRRSCGTGSAHHGATRYRTRRRHRRTYGGGARYCVLGVPAEPRRLIAQPPASRIMLRAMSVC